jgi:hypothetical protein
MAVVWPEKDRQMTRARALKTTIRARAARTGERYTTARRHVLGLVKAATPTPVPEQPPAAPATTRTRTSGPSEEKFIKKTGHGFAHWFSVLDRFGAVEKGHTAAARHLYDDHGVDGWYAQGITVAYERARGVRAVNQRCDGAFEVSVSKVVSGDVPAIIEVLKNPRRRARLRSTDAELLPALGKALDPAGSKGFVVRADGLGRFRYAWGPTTVQVYLTPKPGNKVSVVVTNMKLADVGMVEDRRAAWRALLDSLAAAVSAAS